MIILHDEEPIHRIVFSRSQLVEQYDGLAQDWLRMGSYKTETGSIVTR
jgi:hypothetical protein